MSGRSPSSIVVEFLKSTRVATFSSSISSTAANSQSAMEFSQKVSDWRCMGDAGVGDGDAFDFKVDEDKDERVELLMKIRGLS
ncbi:hypothetical protein QYF36_023871 [Acer negundo]|nr:hypothetical protein QYF36_023871 [Acer negundo]